VSHYKGVYTVDITEALLLIQSMYTPRVLSTDGLITQYKGTKPLGLVQVVSPIGTVLTYSK